MSEEKRKLLQEYLKIGSPVLLENINQKIFEKDVIIESDCDISLLNGHYEGTEFLPPKWYTKLKENSILVINNINKIPSEEQTKFIEILKYKKISTFDLPKNCIIIVTATNLKENKINEEIYSLLAHI